MIGNGRVEQLYEYMQRENVYDAEQSRDDVLKKTAAGFFAYLAEHTFFTSKDVISLLETCRVPYVDAEGRSVRLWYGKNIANRRINKYVPPGMLMITGEELYSKVIDVKIKDDPDLQKLARQRQPSSARLTLRHGQHVHYTKLEETVAAVAELMPDPKAVLHWRLPRL